MDLEVSKCELCDRSIKTEKHHLIPGDKRSDIAYVCELCHKQIHMLFTNGELRKKHYTIKRLLVMPKIQLWLAFIKTKPAAFSISFKESVERKRKRVRYKG